MKNALVTGADGFIGSHLVQLLLKKGINVRALAYYNSFNNWGWLEDVPAHPGLDVVTGDVRDHGLCQDICSGVDTVFNLAALIAIPYSYRAPESYVQTNVTGAVNMCQAALKNGVEKFVQISTSEVYGTARQVPISESHPMQPQSPYSASKIASDSMAMSFWNAFNLPVVIARPFNTYGPRQSARAVIPSIIIQLLKGAKSIKLGSLTPTRDFNYVLDTCQGLVDIAESPQVSGESINIGSGKEISILELFNMIQDILGTQAVIQEDGERLRPAKSEVERLLCDNSKIKRLCGHEPKHNLRAGLVETIEWFKQDKNLRHYKTDIYNV